MSVNEQSTKPEDFDYAVLDRETCILVQQRTDEIKTLIRRSAQDIVELGQKLIEVKDKLGHGHFEAWLKSEFNWSKWTARKFMQAARYFKSVKFTDLNFATTALYILASDSVPEEARQEAIERATQGEAIDRPKAQKIVNSHDQIKRSKGAATANNILSSKQASPAIPLGLVEAEPIDVELEQREQTPHLVRKYVEQVGVDMFNDLIVSCLYEDEVLSLLYKCFDRIEEVALSRLDVSRISFSGLSDSALRLLKEKLEREENQRRYIQN